jgi:CRP-like cAMP-binding protein
MSRQDVGLLADCAVRAEFARGEEIFRRGADASDLYLVESGSVARCLPAPAATE